MNQTHPPIPSTRKRALTLVEILVSVAVMLVMIAAVVTTFITILKSSEESQATIRAVENGRAGLGTLSKDIKAADSVVLGSTFSFPYGNGIDDDSDGRIDEETPNGLDEDGDWIDHHARTSGTLFERPNWVKRVDLGDFGVDEDVLFQNDKLYFRLFPADTSQYLFEDITYQVTSYDGRDRVLTRLSNRLLVDGSLTSRSAPLCYDVMSFDCQYWNPNALVQDQGWLPQWDSRSPPMPGPFTTFVEPAAILVSLTVFADTTPIENYVPGQRVKTMTHRSIINIEKVIQDARFPRNRSGIP